MAVDYNKFVRITVAGLEFPTEPDVLFNFRHSTLNFSLVLESGSAVVEYSFDGQTVHGDLQMGTPTEAMFFDKRSVTRIWFRAKAPESIGASVRIEGWVPA